MRTKNFAKLQVSFAKCFLTAGVTEVLERQKLVAILSRWGKKGVKNRKIKILTREKQKNSPE